MTNEKTAALNNKVITFLAIILLPIVLVVAIAMNITNNNKISKLENEKFQLIEDNEFLLKNNETLTEDNEELQTKINELNICIDELEVDIKDLKIELSYEDILLNNCLFCDNEVKISPINNRFYIRCDICGLQTTYFDSKSELIDYWNKEME